MKTYPGNWQAVYARTRELEAENERLRKALHVVVRRAEGANARAQWVAEPARDVLKLAIDEDRDG